MQIMLEKLTEAVIDVSKNSKIIATVECAKKENRYVKPIGINIKCTRIRIIKHWYKNKSCKHTAKLCAPEIAVMCSDIPILYKRKRKHRKI